MKNLSYIIGCFVILVALASCGARDSQDGSSEVIPSLEVSSFRDEITSIDIIDMNAEEAPYTKKTADSEDEFDRILGTIDSLEFVDPNDFESADSINVKMIFNLQDETERVLEYSEGLVTFDDQEHYCNSGNELVQLYDMLDGEEIPVDEYGKEIVNEEDKANEEDPSTEESKEQNSRASQYGSNQQSSAGQQTGTTQQSDVGGSASTEAASQSSSEIPLGSVGNEYAEEPQDTETLPPLGSVGNEYAEEPQDTEALPPLGSVGNEYAEEPTAEPSPPDDLAEGLSKDPELPDIPPMEPKMKSR